MGRNQLGEFEQAVMLTVSRLRDSAYGVPIWKQLSEQTGREVSIGAVYTTLDRLERKGLVTSRTGDPTPERGGRRKRYFTITYEGSRSLQNAEKAHSRIWGPLPLGSVPV